MTIGVIGASGFVGSAVVSRCLERGLADVCAISRQRPGILADGVEWRRSPELDPASDWTATLTGIETAIIAAARVHVMVDRSADPLREFRRANCDAALRIAQQAAEAGVRRVVFISSIKVNGETTPSGARFTAEDPPAPVDPYGQSKAEAEAGLQEIGRQTGIELVIIRPPLVYGPGVKANFAALVKAVAEGWPLPVGSIRNRRSMVYLENLADLICESAINPAAAGKTFLVSDGADFSTPDLVRSLAEAMGVRARVWNFPPRLLEFAARLVGKGAAATRITRSLAVDGTAARRALDWTPPVSVTEALARTVAER